MATKREREAIYEECILWRHAMGDAPASTPSHVEFGYVLRCRRGCGTHRHLEVNPNSGEINSSSYEHDPRYLEYRRDRNVKLMRLQGVNRGTPRRRLRAVS